MWKMYDHKVERVPVTDKHSRWNDGQALILSSLFDDRRLTIDFLSTITFPPSGIYNIMKVILALWKI